MMMRYMHACRSINIDKPNTYLSIREKKKNEKEITHIDVFNKFINLYLQLETATLFFS